MYQSYTTFKNVMSGLIKFNEWYDKQPKWTEAEIEQENHDLQSMDDVYVCDKNEN